MITTQDNDFIIIKTNHDGDFNVTILNKVDDVIFSELISSLNYEIRLEGFSLKKHTVTISPIILSA